VLEVARRFDAYVTSNKVTSDEARASADACRNWLARRRRRKLARPEARAAIRIERANRMRFQLDRGLQQRAADSQVRLGVLAAAMYLTLRALPLVAIALARGRGDSTGFVMQVTGAFVAASAFTYGLYRRHFVSALALFALWAVGFAYSRVVSATWIPPLGLIGILIGIGLFRGVRGTYPYRAPSPRGSNPL
jgi:hypothetical protein